MTAAEEVLYPLQNHRLRLLAGFEGIISHKEGAFLRCFLVLSIKNQPVIGFGFQLIQYQSAVCRKAVSSSGILL